MFSICFFEFGKAPSLADLRPSYQSDRDRHGNEKREPRIEIQHKNKTQNDRNQKRQGCERLEHIGSFCTSPTTAAERQRNVMLNPQRDKEKQPDQRPKYHRYVSKGRHI